MWDPARIIQFPRLTEGDTNQEQTKTPLELCRNEVQNDVDSVLSKLDKRDYLSELFGLQNYSTALDKYQDDLGTLKIIMKKARETLWIAEWYIIRTSFINICIRNHNLAIKDLVSEWII